MHIKVYPTFFLAVQNANLSDVLMDRAVLNDANLRNANFQRAVLTRYFRAESMINAAKSCLARGKACPSNAHCTTHIATLFVILSECVCRSDLGGADIAGADFTNALVDKTQQIVSC